MKTILCIDDIESNLFTLKSLFEMQENSEYKILTALSAQEGLNTLLHQKVDLILLDIMMPEIDGFQAAKLIKRNKKTREIPIIFLTAKKDPDTIAQCFRVGGNDYISKPYVEEELFARIEFHLRLVRQQRKLKEERDLAQRIIDIQSHLIVITNGFVPYLVNRAVLEFFDVENYEELIQKQGCVFDAFIEGEGLVSHSSIDKGELFVQSLYEKRQKGEEIRVGLHNKKLKQNRYFAVDVEKLRENYLVILSDITLLYRSNEEFEKEATIDELTQVYNKRKFDRILETYLLEKDANDFALIFFDIDHFKKVNDTYGHLAGDEVLQKVAQEAKKSIRSQDTIARWGGEEFVILLPGASLHVAEKKASEIKEAIKKIQFEKIGTVTCSFGVTLRRKNDTIASLISRADKAMYKAKKNGRDRVEAI